MWLSGQPKFQMNWHVIVDVTPWALTFFTMGMLGNGFNDIWDQRATRGALFFFLIVEAAAVLIYASFIVIWRHDPNFVAPPSVYVLTIMILITSGFSCYFAAKG